MFGAEMNDDAEGSPSSVSSIFDLRSIVHLAYESLLDRPPESERVVDHQVALGSAKAILSSIARSDEARAKLGAVRGARSPFYHYAATFDAEATIRRHAKSGIEADPRWLTNFLGVRIEEHYLPEVLGGKAGTIEGTPIPANWHADIAEWAAALRAVDLAHDTFTVAELGCGWGCWLNNAGVAARSRGLKPLLIGVEGDEGHLAFARQCCALNGFTADEVTLHRGIAAARGGTALFPRQDIAGQRWGLEPVFGASEEQKREAARSGNYDILPMIPLDEVVGARGPLDLLHVDIQGGEADLIERSRPILDRSVAYVLIGTHSRVIEGRIAAALEGERWRLEVERPAIVKLQLQGAVTEVDGVQGWRNMALRPD